MAESMVEEPLGFFCHRCWIEIRPVLPSYLCPHCSTGFIEELDSAQTEQPPEADNTYEDIFFVEAPQGRGGFSRSGRGPIPMAYLRNDRSDLAIRRGLDAIRERIAELQRVEFYARDYAWNREGLDAIVTHLLNQMDGSGPPPLAKERIDEIPKVNITQQQADAGLQCPVCWEDFRIEESVRKLMCDHYFHENCIIPWLELHGTCPVCRKWLFEEGSNDESSISESGNEASQARGEHHSNPLTTELGSLLSGELNTTLYVPLESNGDQDSLNSHDMGCG